MRVDENYINTLPFNSHFWCYCDLIDFIMNNDKQHGWIHTQQRCEYNTPRDIVYCEASYSFILLIDKVRQDGVVINMKTFVCIFFHLISLTVIITHEA